MTRIAVTGGSGFIGTNLVQELLDRSYDVVNLDISSPRNPAHAALWKKVDVCEYQSLADLLRDFQPEVVVHLAARTDLNETKLLSGYKVNYEGVRSLVKIAEDIPALRKIIFASSMLVCRPGYQPRDWWDFEPINLYGISKVMGELIVRHASISAEAIVVRPTSIWGPWFGEPYRDFFDYVLKGRFVCPSGKTASKSFGYVGNTVFQIMAIIDSEPGTLDGTVFYLGDYEPLNIRDFAQEIADQAQRGPVADWPRSIFKAAAKLGDILTVIGLRAPMTSYRLQNLTRDNVVRLLEETKTITDDSLPYSFRQGVAETLNWIKMIDCREQTSE